jgi:hypothetical protein
MDRGILVAHKPPMIIADTTGNTAVSILDDMTLNPDLRGEQLVDSMLVANYLRPTLSFEVGIKRLNAIINA